MCVTKILTNLQNGIMEYAVFWGIDLQPPRWRVIFPIGLLGFFIYLILPAAQCPWSGLSLLQK